MLLLRNGASEIRKFHADAAGHACMGEIVFNCIRSCHAELIKSSIFDGFDQLMQSIAVGRFA